MQTKLGLVNLTLSASLSPVYLTTCCMMEATSSRNRISWTINVLFFPMAMIGGGETDASVLGFKASSSPRCFCVGGRRSLAFLKVTLSDISVLMRSMTEVLVDVRACGNGTSSAVRLGHVSNKASSKIGAANLSGKWLYRLQKCEAMSLKCVRIPLKSHLYDF